MDWDPGCSHWFRGVPACGRSGPALLTLVGQAAMLFLIGTVAAGAQQSTTPMPMVFDGVTVVDVAQGKLVPDQRVVVVGNRIEAVEGNRAVPLLKGAQVVDARGKYLIPGLWDMHVHPMQYTDIAYPLFVANGVTGVRDAGSDVPLATLNRWKQEIAAGTRTGPRLIVSGQSINRSAGGNGCPSSWPAHLICVSTPAEARLIVDLFKTAGADMIKTYGLSRELYLAVAAEARRIGILFGGHVSDNSRLGGLEASDSGAAILDHGGWLNPFVCGLNHDSDVPVAISFQACAAAAERLRRNNTWITITALTLGVNLPRLPYAQRYSPASFLRADHVPADSAVALPGPTSTVEWARHLFGDRGADTAQLNGLRLMHQAGLPLLAGTDMITSSLWQSYSVMTPGYSVPQLLLAFVLGGMTPLEALQTATLNPALALRATDSLGTVETGKLADMVLLDADPLADIWNATKIRAVVANGRYYDRAALDRLLAAAEQAAAQR